MPDSADDHRQTAGAFGFTRREIAVLSGVIGVCIAVIAYDDWRDSRRAAGPDWLIEDVLIQSEPPSLTDTLSVRRDSVVGSPRQLRDHSDLIDINTADVRTLARLPGIGPQLAKRILAEREANGAFVNLLDVQRVRGIGPRKAAMLSGWIRFSAPSKPADSAETP